MEALTVTGRVLGSPDFLLAPDAGYTIVSVGPGVRSWQANTVESPFMHGRVLVSRRLEQGSVPLVVRVSGVTVSQVATRTAALVAALEQFSFTLEVTVDGVVSQWACEGADSSPGDGGSFDDVLLGNYMQLMTFQIPRHPIPLAGAL
jgi:hypothetical protein